MVHIVGANVPSLTIHSEPRADKRVASSGRTVRHVREKKIAVTRVNPRNWNCNWREIGSQHSLWRAIDDGCRHLSWAGARWAWGLSLLKNCMPNFSVAMEKVPLVTISG